MDTRSQAVKKIKFANKRRFVFVMTALLAFLIFGFFINISVGSVNIEIKTAAYSVVKAIKLGVLNIISGGKYSATLSEFISSSTENQILFGIRLPRMLLAAILGGALSVSGFLLQTFFRNPIAGPFVLGISSGAKMTVGITTICLSSYANSLGSLSAVAAAFVGSLLVTAVVLLFSGRAKSMSMLLVIGIMIGYICSAITDFVITFANDYDIANLTGWSMGTFSGASGSDVKISALICLPTFLIVWLLSKPISLYALGEGYAENLGVNVRLFRVVLILLSGLLSSCVTAFAGPVSFVGIAVPHIAKALLKSSKPSFVIPAVFVCGAVFCIFCDLIARTVFAPTELAIGTVTSIFGAPIVIYVMIKRKRENKI